MPLPFALCYETMYLSNQIDLLWNSTLVFIQGIVGKAKRFSLKIVLSYNKIDITEYEV